MPRKTRLRLRLSHRTYADWPNWSLGHHQSPLLVLRKRCGCQCHRLKGAAAKRSGRSTRSQYIEAVAPLFPAPTFATESANRVIRCDAKKQKAFSPSPTASLRHSMPGAGVVHNIIRDRVLQLLSAASISQPPHNSAERFLTGQPVRHSPRSGTVDRSDNPAPHRSLPARGTHVGLRSRPLPRGSIDQGFC